MNPDEHRSELNRITKQIIGCVYRVSNTLGCGFLEKVYENALVIELNRARLCFQQQHPIKVLYDSLTVGEYAVDLLVEDKIIVELKAARAFDEIHSAQCMNYLRASNLSICLLVNFGAPGHRSSASCQTTKADTFGIAARMF
jgi:GxxExxY protein